MDEILINGRYQPAILPPSIETRAPGQGGGASAFLAGISNVLTGAGPLSAASPISAGIAGLAGLAGGLFGGGPSTATSTTTAGPITSTGWGAMNNPFVVGGQNSRISDVSAKQDAPVSLDNRPSANASTDAASAPFIEGGTGGFFMMLAVAAIAYVVLKR